MNNISSCLVKSMYVAFLVLIVNDHSLHGTRLLRVTLCMPEIIGEKIDEDVIHPCQFITNDIIITNPLIGHCSGISLVLSNKC